MKTAQQIKEFNQHQITNINGELGTNKNMSSARRDRLMAQREYAESLRYWIDSSRPYDADAFTKEGENK